MKKLLCFMLLAATAVAAGMFRSSALLALAVALLGLYFFLFITARSNRKRLSAAFERKVACALVGEETVLRLTMHNTGMRGGLRAKVRLNMRYAGEKKERKRVIKGIAPKRTGEISFTLCAPLCGALTLSVTRVWASDPLGIFAAGSRQASEMTVAVIPSPAQEVFETLWANGESPDEGEENRYGISWAQDDIRQIREYRDGDPLRHIHWNQSAKTDRLWVKEYEGETYLRVGVRLDAEGLGALPPKMADAYIRAAACLTRALLMEIPSVLVVFGDAGGIAVQGEEDCREMLLLLILASTGVQQEFLQPSADCELNLGADLRLLYNGKPVRTFRAEDWAYGGKKRKP